MIKIKEKPLSVNDAWKGKRYKTDKYKAYEIMVYSLLPKKIDIPDGKLEVWLEFGFSSNGSDADNPIKPFVDILQKKYKFNDNRIFRYCIDKVIVKKGQEYIRFRICKYLL